MLLGKDFLSNFEEESEEHKATLDDLVTGAILRPKINGSDPRPPVLITDDYRRKWDTLQFSAALPIGKHALMKTKDLSTTEFDESRLTKETIVRPSYFGLKDGTDRFSIRIDVNIGNMIPQENGSIDYNHERKVLEEIQNSEKLITVLLQDSKDIGDETKPRIILVAEDEKIIQEYEAKSQIYTQKELRSGLEIEPTNGLYHDEVPRYTNEPETFSILKNQENKYRI